MGLMEGVGSQGESDMAKKVIIFDTTLRDGEQSPGASLNTREKLQIARYLQMMQIDVIEAGFPFASRGDLEAVRNIAREIRGPQIAGLARARKEDLDAAWEAVKEAENPQSPHLYLHLGYSSEISDAEITGTSVGRGGGSGQVCLPIYLQCGIFGDGRVPKRPGLCGPGLYGGHRGRGHHG